MNLLPVKPKSDITIVSCLYYEPYRANNSYTDDVFIVIYRDEFDEKKVEFIPRPTIEIYFTKPEHRNYVTPRLYIREEKTYMIECRYTKVLDAISKELKRDDSEIGRNFKAILSKAYDTNNYRLKKELFKYPYALFSDMDIDSRYRMELAKTYSIADRVHTFRQSFMDIEADMYNDAGVRFTDHEANNLGLSKVNMITIMFMYNPKTQKNDGNIHSYTFALKDYDRYKGQKEFFSDSERLYDACLKEVSDVVITIEGKEYNFLEKCGMGIKFTSIQCDSEKELLERFWMLFHAAAPDTCDVWNIAYDIPKIHDRLEMNNLNPVNVMSHPGIPEEIRYLNFHIDKRAGIEMCNRTTKIELTCLTQFIDQMILYAATNKGRKDYGDNSLDNVSWVEGKIRKKKFSKRGVDVLNAAHKLYNEFYLYSIIDVLNQVVIEFITNHTENLMYEVNMTATNPFKINKLNTYLRNVYYAYYVKVGYIPGNNRNTNYVDDRDADDYQDEIDKISEDLEDGTDEERMANAIRISEDDFCDSPFKKQMLKAGLVANPNLNRAVGAEIFEGLRSSHIFPDSMDMDYRAHYPTSTIVGNISAPTEYGRIIIKEKISPEQNRHGEEKYIPGGEYIYDLIAGDYVTLGGIWHGLGSTLDLLKELDERTGEKSE